MITPRIGITSTPVVHEGLALESCTRAYVDAVIAAGGVPVLLPVLPLELVGPLLDGLDGVLLSGGGDIDPRAYGAASAPETVGIDEERDRFELALVRMALAGDLPILGICRGHQVLNVALGGALDQHVPHLTGNDHQERVRVAEEIHRVDLLPASQVARVVGTPSIGVNTLHHQAVRVPGDHLDVVGRSDDGLVEAVEGADGLRVIGVQWHPELLTAWPEHEALFRWLVDEAAVERAVGPVEVGPVSSLHEAVA